jgi:hypothetical protein
MCTRSTIPHQGVSPPHQHQGAAGRLGDGLLLQVSKRLKRQVYKTSGLQNVRFTKLQVFKTSGSKKHPYIFCTCGWWKSAGSVAAMFAGKEGMAVFYTLILYFRGFFAIYHHNG